MWKLFLCFDQYKAYGKHSTTLDAWLSQITFLLKSFFNLSLQRTAYGLRTFLTTPASLIHMHAWMFLASMICCMCFELFVNVFVLRIKNKIYKTKILTNIYIYIYADQLLYLPPPFTQFCESWGSSPARAGPARRALMLMQELLWQLSDNFSCLYSLNKIL
jgi:hypothetical protein